MGVPQHEDDLSEVTFAEDGASNEQNYASVMDAFRPNTSGCSKSVCNSTSEVDETTEKGLCRTDTFVGYDEWDAPIMSLVKVEEVMIRLHEACAENEYLPNVLSSTSPKEVNDNADLSININGLFRDYASIAPLKHSELLLGVALGKGSFSSAYELQSIRFGVESASSHSSYSNESSPTPSSTEDPASAPDYTQDQRLARARVQSRCISDSATYVVKVLQPKLAHFPRMLASCAADLAKEGAMLASMQHPHIVKIHGWAATGLQGFQTGRHDSFFLVLDRLHETLATRMCSWHRRAKGRSKRRLSSFTGSGHRAQAKKHERRMGLLSERLTVVLQLSDALQYLHSCRIIHRDLKPDNIGFDRETRDVKVFDFDLARKLPGPDDTPYDKEFLLTQQVGSPRYMSPECARGEPYNVSSDVYSFGLIAHEVLSLAKPFDDIDAGDLEDVVVQAGVRPVVPWTWPSIWQTILPSCWCDKAADRLRMKEVYELLRDRMPNLLVDVPRCYYVMGKTMTKALSKSKRGLRASFSEFGAKSLRAFAFHSISGGSIKSAGSAAKKFRKRTSRRVPRWLTSSHHQSETSSNDSVHFSSSDDDDDGEFIM